jgi:hypothetical protein
MPVDALLGPKKGTKQLGLGRLQLVSATAAADHQLVSGFADVMRQRLMKGRLVK